MKNSPYSRLFFTLSILWSFSTFSALTESEILSTCKKLFLSEKLLTLDKKDAEVLIEKIRFIAEQKSLNEKDLLSDLLTFVQGEKEYHIAHINRDYDPRRVKRYARYALTCAVAFTTIPLLIYFVWYKPLKNEQELLEKRHTIKVKVEESFGSHNTIRTTTTYTMNKNGMDDLQCRSILDHYISLVKKSDSLETGVFLASFPPLLAALTSYIWNAMPGEFNHSIFARDPAHAQRAEKFLELQAILEQALTQPRKNFTFDRDDVLIAEGEEQYQLT